jgi:bifunctional UDP-N-acetylglucosamine pyrophosphorylase/glucosamine-1-phosphate N-acetyltransferase
MTKTIAIVLAAGHGTRMRSELPKVLHQACGRPLVYFPVFAALEAGARKVVVVVNEQTREPISEALAAHLPADTSVTALQAVPRGTGDALRVAMETIEATGQEKILTLAGDAPLVRPSDLGDLLAALDEEHTLLSFLTFQAADPTGYGRILRDSEGKAYEVREHRDLKTSFEQAITEVNAGVYAARASALRTALSTLTPKNDQGEYYVTDIVAEVARKARVASIVCDEASAAGVNDRFQLAEVEAKLFRRIRERLGKKGVTLKGTPLIDDTVEVGEGACLEDGVRLRGRTKIGARSFVDVGSVIVDSVVGEDVTIKPYCVISQSYVGNLAQVGPFAHLRPESVLEEDVRIGNFVETKKTLVKRGAKANHLAYLGDAEIGERSNLGAGTIICNYDGFRKSRTVLGAGVFVGSDSQLVAPVTLGDGAYVATGTTVVSDVPKDGLAIGRCRQQNKEGYAKKLRERLKAAAAEAQAKKDS